MCRMETVASTTAFPETGCPVMSDGELHHETLPLERLRRVVCHGVSGMEAVAATTINPEFHCPVKSL